MTAAMVKVEGETGGMDWESQGTIRVVMDVVVRGGNCWQSSRRGTQRTVSFVVFGVEKSER